MKERIYRGRGQDEILSIIQTTGQNLTGEIVRANGDHVAEVEFSVVNGDLYLTVDGQQYTSITNALHEMAPDLATHDAEGSEGSGNVANNVIGNYAILKHVILDGCSMYDIAGGFSARKPRAQGLRRAKIKAVVRPDAGQVPAQGNLYQYFRRDQIVEIARSLGGAEQFQAAIQGMTVAEFSQKYSVEIG